MNRISPGMNKVLLILILLLLVIVVILFLLKREKYCRTLVQGEGVRISIFLSLLF